MRKKFLLSVLMSIGIVVGGVGLAYAFGTFNAIQQGSRQGGEGQAARLTMTVEAGTPDGNSDLLPDQASNCSATQCPGGALAFAITNTSDFPIQVTKIDPLSACGLCGIIVSSNKNENGTFGNNLNSPSCATHVTLSFPANFRAWPTIAPHTTLHVNGTDGNQLGAGMIHLNPGTPDGCQGALFSVALKVTATEATGQELPFQP